MSDIQMNNSYHLNHPEVLGAGLLGDIVNKRWADEWVSSNQPQFKPFDQMALDVLIEDFNKRAGINPTEGSAS